MFTDSDRELLNTQLVHYQEMIAAQQQIYDYIKKGLAEDSGDEEWWAGYMEVVQFFMQVFMSQFLEADPEAQEFALDYIGAEKKEEGNGAS